MEVFLASKAVLLVAPTIAVNIVEAVNCLAGANSGQQARIVASLRQRILHLVLIMRTHLLLMTNRRGI